MKCVSTASQQGYNNESVAYLHITQKITLKLLMSDFLILFFSIIKINQISNGLTDKIKFWLCELLMTERKKVGCFQTFLKRVIYQSVCYVESCQKEKDYCLKLCTSYLKINLAGNFCFMIATVMSAFYLFPLCKFCLQFL